MKQRVRLALKDAKNWEKAPLTTAGETYRYGNMDVSWSSMSEAYEQQFPMLMNFVSSSVQKPLAEVE